MNVMRSTDFLRLRFLSSVAEIWYRYRTIIYDLATWKVLRMFVDCLFVDASLGNVLVAHDALGYLGNSLR